MTLEAERIIQMEHETRILHERIAEHEHQIIQKDDAIRLLLMEGYIRPPV